MRRHKKSKHKKYFKEKVKEKNEKKNCTFENPESCVFHISRGTAQNSGK